LRYPKCSGSCPDGRPQSCRREDGHWCCLGVVPSRHEDYDFGAGRRRGSGSGRACRRSALGVRSREVAGAPGPGSGPRRRRLTPRSKGLARATRFDLSFVAEEQDPCLTQRLVRLTISEASGRPTVGGTLAAQRQRSDDAALLTAVNSAGTRSTGLERIDSRRRRS
jgi:hypothetical protein